MPPYTLPIAAYPDYDIARKRYRRLLPEVRVRERAREAKRVRSADSKNPPKDKPRKNVYVHAEEEWAVQRAMQRGEPYCSKHGFAACDCASVPTIAPPVESCERCAESCDMSARLAALVAARSAIDA